MSKIKEGIKKGGLNDIPTISRPSTSPAAQSVNQVKLNEIVLEIIDELEDIQSDYYSSQQSAKGENYSRAGYISEGIEVAIKVINQHMKGENK